jgi:hypothetical protein
LDLITNTESVGICLSLILEFAKTLVWLLVILVEGQLFFIMYHAGKPIAGILWMMRSRSQTTLDSYLQGVAALNVLGPLSLSSRASTKAFAATFPLLPHSSPAGHRQT